MERLRFVFLSTVSSLIQNTRNHQRITNARYGFNVGWLRGVWFHFCAQAIDQLFEHGAVATIGTPNGADQLFCGQYLTGVQHQRFQQAHLELGQPHRRLPCA